MNIQFISIKSVLADLSTSLPEENFNPHILYEWAAIGYNKIKPNAGYSLCNALIPISQHSALLPDNCLRVMNLAVAPTISESDQAYFESLIRESLSLNEPNNVYLLNGNLLERVLNTANNYRRFIVMRKSTSDFMPSVVNDEVIKNYLSLVPQYKICQGNSVLTNIESGLLLVSYLGSPKAENGDILIPDNQDLKEAIYHYCMYRWYSSKIATAETNSLQHYKQEREFHLTLFQTLSLKSKSIDLPDAATLENLTNIHNRMFTRTDAFEDGFSNILIPEQIKY